MAEIDENLEECGIEELYQGPQQLPQTKKRYWARIDNPGDSSFGKDALIPFEQFEAERERILQRGGRPPSIKTRVEMPPGNGKKSLQVGDRVKSSAWKGIKGYPWLTVKGVYTTEWMGKPMLEVEVTDGITTNRVFEDTIIAHEPARA